MGIERYIEMNESEAKEIIRKEIDAILKENFDGFHCTTSQLREAFDAHIRYLESRKFPVGVKCELDPDNPMSIKVTFSNVPACVEIPDGMLR